MRTKLLTNGVPDDELDLNSPMEGLQLGLTRFIAARVGSAEDIEDIAQEVWRRAWRHIRIFKRRSGTLTWLVSIARCAVADHYRAQHPGREVSLEYLQLVNPESLAGAQIDPVPEVITASESLATCNDCLGCTLPIQQQLSVMLCDIYGFTNREASQILGEKPAKLKHLLHQARSALEPGFRLKVRAGSEVWLPSRLRRKRSSAQIRIS